MICTQTTIVKWGNSQGIRLPKHLLESANISENDIVDVTAETDIIVIRKAVPKKKRRTLKERLEGIDTSNYVWEEWGSYHGLPTSK